MVVNLISVLIAENEMQAKLRISSSGDGITPEDVLKALRKENVVFGIDNGLVTKIVEEQLFDQDIVVAQGAEPIIGQDTQQKYFFDTVPKEPKPVTHEDGSVDHYNLDTVLQVEAGVLLARMTLPTKGISGTTVTGKELRTRDGRDLPIRAGYNVSVSDDGLQFFAKIAGCPKLIGHKVHVSTQYTIETDIDFSTGNIEFNGDVVIKGTVLDGFSVKATGNVDVYGNIKNAFVEAGGTVNALGGIVAKDRGHVKAGVNVNAVFIESANIEAGHNVVVRKAIMHSNVRAGGSIFCDEGKGLIVGGELYAGIRLQAKEVGSEYATRTVIETGKREMLKRKADELSDEFDKSRENYNKLKVSEAKLQETIAVLEKTNSDLAKIEQMKGLVSKTKDAQNGIIERIKQIREEKALVIDQLSHVQAPRISISGNIYPGVDLSLDGYKFKVERPLLRVTFFESEGKVKAGKYVAEEKE